MMGALEEMPVSKHDLRRRIVFSPSVAPALLAGAASGRRIGEEAETIARGLKP